MQCFLIIFTASCRHVKFPKRQWCCWCKFPFTVNEISALTIFTQNRRSKRIWKSRRKEVKRKTNLYSDATFLETVKKKKRKKGKKEYNLLCRFTPFKYVYFFITTLQLFCGRTLEHADCIHGGKRHTPSYKMDCTVRYTNQHLMVRLYFCKLGEWEVPLYDPEK